MEEELISIQVSTVLGTRSDGENGLSKTMVLMFPDRLRKLPYVAGVKSLPTHSRQSIEHVHRAPVKWTFNLGPEAVQGLESVARLNDRACRYVTTRLEDDGDLFKIMYIVQHRS